MVGEAPMLMLIIILFAVHALGGVFWAGSTFALARSGGEGAGKLFRPQMGAASITVLAGVGLWTILHRGALGPMEKTLAIGALCAVAAAAVQGGCAGLLVSRSGLRRGCSRPPLFAWSLRDT